MPEPAWHPVRVPPLRSDIDRRLREFRRAERRLERNGWLTLSGLLGATVGALAALQPENFL